MFSNNNSRKFSSPHPSQQSQLSGFGNSNLDYYQKNQQNNNTFRVNPLAFSSLKNLDVDKLEEDIAKDIQRKKALEEKTQREIRKIYDESNEIQELKSRIKMAKLNEERSMQIYEKQNRKLQNLVKDAETDEKLLENLENERYRLQEEEIRKKMEKLSSKYVLQQQMKDREKLKEESKAEYERDRQLVDNIVNNIIQEDLNQLRIDREKKAATKFDMEQAYADKAERIMNQKTAEKMQKEKERQYFEELARRDVEQKMKKAAIQEEKDKIFEKLSAEQERKKAEKEYWENVRNDLYVEEMKRRDKIAELQEQEKKQRYIKMILIIL
jgi:hypothetical protein